MTDKQKRSRKLWRTVHRARRAVISYGTQRSVNLYTGVGLLLHQLSQIIQQFASSLLTALAWEVMQSPPSVCFHSIPGTDWPTTVDYEYRYMTIAGEKLPSISIEDSFSTVVRVNKMKAKLENKLSSIEVSLMSTNLHLWPWPSIQYELWSWSLYMQKVNVRNWCRSWRLVPNRRITDCKKTTVYWILPQMLKEAKQSKRPNQKHAWDWGQGSKDWSHKDKDNDFTVRTSSHHNDHISLKKQTRALTDLYIRGIRSRWGTHVESYIPLIILNNSIISPRYRYLLHLNVGSFRIFKRSLYGFLDTVFLELTLYSF